MLFTSSISISAAGFGSPSHFTFFSRHDRQALRATGRFDDIFRIEVAATPVGINCILVDFSIIYRNVVKFPNIVNAQFEDVLFLDLQIRLTITDIP